MRLCSQALLAELGHVKQAVKVPLVEVLALVREVHEGVSTVNQELALCPVADLEDDLASEAASRATEEDEAELMSRRFRRAPAWPKGPRLQLGARAATHRSASPPGLLFQAREVSRRYIGAEEAAAVPKTQKRPLLALRRDGGVPPV